MHNSAIVAKCVVGAGLLLLGGTPEVGGAKKAGVMLQGAVSPPHVRSGGSSAFKCGQWQIYSGRTSSLCSFTDGDLKDSGTLSQIDVAENFWKKKLGPKYKAELILTIDEKSKSESNSGSTAKVVLPLDSSAAISSLDEFGTLNLKAVVMEIGKGVNITIQSMKAILGRYGTEFSGRISEYPCLNNLMTFTLNTKNGEVVSNLGSLENSTFPLRLEITGLSSENSGGTLMVSNGNNGTFTVQMPTASYLLRHTGVDSFSSRALVERSNHLRVEFGLSIARCETPPTATESEDLGSSNGGGDAATSGDAWGLSVPKNSVVGPGTGGDSDSTGGGDGVASGEEASGLAGANVGGTGTGGQVSDNTGGEDGVASGEDESGSAVGSGIGEGGGSGSSGGGDILNPNPESGGPISKRGDGEATDIVGISIGSVVGAIFVFAACMFARPWAWEIFQSRPLQHISMSSRSAVGGSGREEAP